MKRTRICWIQSDDPHSDRTLRNIAHFTYVTKTFIIHQILTNDVLTRILNLIQAEKVRLHETNAQNWLTPIATC